MSRFRADACCFRGLGFAKPLSQKIQVLSYSILPQTKSKHLIIQSLGPLLKGSWDLVTRVMKKATILILVVGYKL